LSRLLRRILLGRILLGRILLGRILLGRIGGERLLEPPDYRRLYRRGR